MGTYWPVGDDAASVFGGALYRGLVAGEPLGPALVHARRAVLGRASADWADYLFYGSPDFVLKRKA